MVYRTDYSKVETNIRELLNLSKAEWLELTPEGKEALLQIFYPISSSHDICINKILFRDFINFVNIICKYDRQFFKRLSQFYKK